MWIRPHDVGKSRLISQQEKDTLAGQKSPLISGHLISRPRIGRVYILVISLRYEP